VTSPSPPSSSGGAGIARAKALPNVVFRFPGTAVTVGEIANREGRRFSVLGVNVDAVQIDEVIARMRDWIENGKTARYIAVTGMHGVMEARNDARFTRVLAEADLVVPDGMPLVWLGRLRGHELRNRVYGPELMLEFCHKTANTTCRHFFYGGDARVAEQLVESLAKLCPGIRIAGTYSPPFRPLTPQEDAEIVNAINLAAPDVLWVGLSTPKQEMWMGEHRDRLRVPVMVGVGAAFDFLSARKKQAPCWMREHGLEWLFRVLQEPRRLWRRYLLNGTEFVFLVALELLGLRRFE
jgi:N-acetylglucosaminyldiphosphoundecaprenol N-acetyl-beta-D-mannosaminyltransferase